MNFQNDLENEKQKVRLVIRINIGLFIIIMFIVNGWNNAQSDIDLHYPPDLRSGATMKAGEIPPSEVFLFAQYMLQQLNDWDVNGAIDYPNNVNQLRFYLTPRYRQTLKGKIEHLPHGELRDRVRTFRPTPGVAYSEKDVVLNGDSWIVWLDVNIKETVLGEPVKDITMRYPIRVVRYDTNREMNPWQLALDGHGGFEPKRIDLDLKMVKNDD